MTRAVEDLTSVDHACAVPISDEQLWEMTAGFLAGGLAAGEHVIYFDDGTADAVLDRLADDRVPVERPLADGRLTILPPDTTRSALRSPVWQATEMIGDAVQRALARGAPSVRITGQFDYALRRLGGVSQREYDAGFDEIVRELPVRLLCFFDRRRYPDDAIEEMREQHHTELVAPAIYDDNLLRITSTGVGSARLAGEADHSNRQRISRLLEATLDHALRAHSAPTDITLDLASLRFLDVAGAVSLVHAAEEFPSSHRLVLTGVRPRVARVLDRCGAPFAGQLVLQNRSEFEPMRAAR